MSVERALELAPIVERVHGPGHPEMTRIREIVEAVNAAEGDADELFVELRGLTNDYTPPADTCETVDALYGALHSMDTAR